MKKLNLVLGAVALGLTASTVFAQPMTIRGEAQKVAINCSNVVFENSSHLKEQEDFSSIVLNQCKSCVDKSSVGYLKDEKKMRIAEECKAFVIHRIHEKK
ncbi:MAG: hypothetical protein AB7E13_11385 [Arcobacteraceae bacterium]